MNLQARRRLVAAVTGLFVSYGAHAIDLVAREANLYDSQAVSDPSSAWRAFACMVPFTTSGNKELLMLYGGTSSLKDKDPLSIADKGTNTLQIFDINNNKLYAPATANTPKVGPVLPGCGAASGSIWVYDSQYGVPGNSSKAVSLLDNAHWSWSSPTELGQLPVTRFGAAFVYVPDNRGFYMHGGIPLSANTNKAKSSSDTANNLDILSPSKLTWGYASNGPARKYHTLCYMSAIEAIVLFGGSDGNVESYNDIKLLSTKTNTWKYSIPVDGDAPSERILHSAVCSNDTMYVFGGLHSSADDPFDSIVWLLKADDEGNLSWSRAPISGSNQNIGPTARAGHSASFHDGNMYIYGGIGPSGYDDIMYKLDVRSWEWSRSSVTNSSAKAQSDSNNKTAVLIAAIVSSVLGVMVIGIAATIIYRVLRRRNREFSSLDHGQGDGNSMLSGNAHANGAVAMNGPKGDNGQGGGKVPYNGDSTISYTGLYDGDRTNASDILIHPNERLTQGPALLLHDRETAEKVEAVHLGSGSGSGSDSSRAAAATLPIGGHSCSASMGDISPMFSTGVPINTSNNGTPVTSPISMTSGRTALLPTSKNSPSSRQQMVDSVRAHARSLSHRFGASRFTTAFSDGSDEPVPEVPPTRRRRTSALPSTSTTRRSVASSKHTAVANLYGSDQARMENEYRQAEAINEILLSGQPIPTWLRDAVNKAGGGEDIAHRPEHADSTAAASSSPPADLGRRFMIANDPNAK
ncbi:hypothetical protein COEREDRAFT_83521 [Coemansia reversa NRRL 1564]|uniref:Galactose oxidase n=1 Tax=Coemansia reversa (strain ATCC 12441 / NRRL 1564) TaxID=763665 RepID=A0A2G5B310_COERN|nr:hypothetical protein COEREDRAFT_83521 [Coemansia reversa NRRL 1564]|eukprot:PIA13408.1 hypothetical protein COEREDRAFT_83521 [Coemansia reversa NRRL 1564]